MEPKKYDLEELTLQFAIDCRMFLKKLPKTISNQEDGKQLVRSSGSVGANYIEANESLSKKDFNYRIKISRKEAKESAYWLKIIKATNTNEFEKNKYLFDSRSRRVKENIFSNISKIDLKFKK